MRAPWWIALLAVSGCDDHLLGVGQGARGEGWCAVQAVLEQRCVACHTGEAAEAGLDLSRDAHGALVDQPSQTDPGQTLVVPGDAGASFLVAKISGELAPGEGAIMPPVGALDEPTVDVVRRWVDEGAPGSCDTTGGGAPTGTTPTTAELEGWCGVQQLVANQCIGCHGSAAPMGELDLETDPHAALVGAASTTDPSLVLVTPGDVDGSFLITKLRDGQAAGQGTVMPPTGQLSDERVAVVEDWVAAGADAVCDQTIVVDEGHHPQGYGDPLVHGPAAKLQEERCIDCHGASLEGEGEAAGCDACHGGDAWRTDCVFCHGGVDNGTGAPPRHISGEDEGADASFVPHTRHVSDTPIKDGLPCTSCHDEPTSVLSVGHLFVGDATPGVAEVSFVASLSSRARWSAGTCSDLYCHGDGQGHNGTMNHLGTIDSCDDCHPSLASGRAAWKDMSGEHENHLEPGMVCADCHVATTTGGSTIAETARHVDGVVDVVFASTGIRRNGNTCTGLCHGEPHQRADWR